MRIIVATHNEGKLVEIRRILADHLGDAASRVELVSAGSLGLPDPVETGTSFEANALLKARDVAHRTGLPAVADDSGLVVDVMGSAPGILSARWSGVHGDDEANNRLLLAQLSDIPEEARTARFRCAAALVVPDSPAGVDADGASDSVFVVPSAEDDVTPIDALPSGLGAAGLQTVAFGEMPGRIIRHPRGGHGFGYDPLFVPDDQPTCTAGSGNPLTSAEMTPEEKNAISHRGRAFIALVPAVRLLLGE
ncbi:non-canonical purine NTP pyrophosphatase [uncultured Bifidobacterium sp.]|uniref:non-canonical purine NTP pyrophosphatase n=1 Tax=uncultured Bifidobacterium sp. TaxID=165187 RepID=UPI0028DB3D33|nr:non-canonical purine NTP pyrophosphatase [uncultured Bifidobacterium sp.]